MDACTLQLEAKAFEIFAKLKEKLDQVGHAVKSLKAARRKGVKNVIMNNDGGGSGDEPLKQI